MFKEVEELVSVVMLTDKNLKVLSMESTFENCDNLFFFNNTGLYSEKFRSTKKLFYETSLTENYFNDFNSINLEDISYMLAFTLISEFQSEGINTKNVKTMSHLFEECISLTKVDLSLFDTSNSVDISYMFAACGAFKILDFSIFDISKVTNMLNMLQNCISLTELNINKKDTSKVEDMPYMLDSYLSLENFDLSNLDTKNVKNMKYMFKFCSGIILKNIAKNTPEDNKYNYKNQ